MSLRKLLVDRYQPGHDTIAEETSILDAALDYSRRGWSVIPMKGKRPMVPWKKFQDARAEESQIRDWFSDDGPTGVGIVTGAISSVFVLDVDVGPEKDGQESLGKLQLDHHGALPDTLLVRTGGGGQHFYFRLPDGVEVRNATDLEGYPGLDIRGDGGYVVAPPSKHESGCPYEWIDSVVQEPAEAPPWLIDLVKTDHTQRGAAQGNASYPPAEIDPIVEGCGFIAHCRDDAGTLSEQDWYSMLSIVGRCEDGERLAHEWSKSYPTYDPTETDEKLKHALEAAGPRTCKDISRNGGREICLQCPHRGRIKSPIVLGSTGGGSAGADFINIVERRADIGNGRALVKRHGDKIRHVRQWGWLAWDGTRWKTDAEKEVQHLCKDVARHIFDLLPDETNVAERDRLFKHAVRSHQQPRLNAMMKCAESEPQVDARTADFDRDEWLLNVANGTLDLQNGKLLPHSELDLITKLAPVKFDPDAECPHFEKFLDRIFRGQRDMIPFLQRVFGYALTGSGEGRYFFILHGTGRNGKTTLLEVFRHVMGEYAGVIPITALTKSRNVNSSGPTPELASLRGKRFVTSSEPEEEHRLAEALVKQFTGNGQVVARALYQGMIEFSTTFKMFLDRNHIPGIGSGDEAMWDRTILIPFSERISDDEINRELQEELKEEAAGILAWAVRGCLRYQEEGLNPPSRVTNAGQEYRKENDLYGQFLEEHCVVKEGLEVPFRDVFRAFSVFYMTELGGRGDPISRITFSKNMTRKGFVRSKKGGDVYFRGVGLK